MRNAIICTAYNKDALCRASTWYPASPGAFTGQQPPEDRADELPAVFAAGYPVFTTEMRLEWGINVSGDRMGYAPMQWNLDRNAGFS